MIYFYNAATSPVDDEVYEEASPLVLDGAGLGIIEDVGGVGAMSDCVKAF